MRETNSPPLERNPEKPALQGGPGSFDGARHPPRRWRGRLLAGALTVTVHLLVLAALLWPHVRPPRAHADLQSLQVSLIDQPKPKPLLAPPDAVTLDAMQPAPPHVPAPVFTVASAPDTSDLLSESQLAGAAIAGTGGGGGGCDIARVVQQALRRDPMVQTVVADAHRSGKAIMVWNGDWVRSGDQDGKGLSAVREAITWEVAFAPEACRNTRMHGLVLLSLGDGSTRFAVGAGDWRWSDLLGVRR